MAILGIQNCAVETFGQYERVLGARGVEFKVVHAYRGQAMPTRFDGDAVLVAGTPTAAYEIDTVPFLRAERDFLSEVVAAGQPCFGVCFGGQILAQILGAQVKPHDPKEIGVYDARLTPPGREDPLLAGFPARFPVLQWHGDTFDVPSQATLLAEGDVCRNQMFRQGSVVGVQFHLEIDTHEASTWARDYAGELAESGKNAAEFTAECRERESEMLALADLLLTNFLESVVGLERPR